MTYSQALKKASSLLPQYQFSLAAEQQLNHVGFVIHDHEFKLGNEIHGYLFCASIFEASNQVLREEISGHFLHYKVATFRLARILL